MSAECEETCACKSMDEGAAQNYHDSIIARSGGSVTCASSVSGEESWGAAGEYCTVLDEEPAGGLLLSR